MQLITIQMKKVLYRSNVKKVIDICLICILKNELGNDVGGPAYFLISFSSSRVRG